MGVAVLKKTILMMLVVLPTMALADRVHIQRDSGNDGGGGDNRAINRIGGDRDRNERQGRTQQPPLVIKMRRYNMPKPDRIRDPNHILHDRQRIEWPTRDERGERIIQRPAVVAPRQHTVIMRDRVILRDIDHQQRVEVVPNHYYWHTNGGVRYCHYYGSGIHWYGFYHGPHFYWTRYYGNRWWWFDGHFDRWVYWWDGYWWWPGPAGALYVYVNNNYYPYDAGYVTVREPEIEAPPASSPAPTEGSSWKSSDGTRMVQVFGDKALAFLYDTTSGQPVFMKYIGEYVEKVRFSGGGNKPLKILAELRGGSFAIFDANGNPLDAVQPDVSPPPPTTPPPDNLPYDDQEGQPDNGSETQPQ